MRFDRFTLAGSAALLVLAAGGCDTGPTEPRDEMSTALMFAEVPSVVSDRMTSGTVGDFAHEFACPEGGSMTLEGSITVEEDGSITIRRTSLVRRYDGCGVRRGRNTVVADGELAYEGEIHVDYDGKLPRHVVYHRVHQVGHLTIADGGRVRTCEYDLETVIDPESGHFHHKGIACGFPVDVQRTFNPWRSYSRSL